MKTIASVSLCVVGILVACGGGDPATIDAPGSTIDAGIDAPTGAPIDGADTACNPLGPPGQQGCGPGEKCTWVIVQETPELIGELSCMPEGAQQLGQACTAGAPGASDDCAAGLICIGAAGAATCSDICGFDGSADAQCASGYGCTRYAGLFANGADDPIAGACEALCDPITQLRTDGTDCGLGRGCYLLVNQTDTVAVCSAAGTVMHDEDIVGPAFANTCVPGAQPRRKDQTSQTNQCGGLCAMVDVTSTLNMAAEGGTSPDSCSERWGAAPPGDGTAGESCRYWWAREPFDTLSASSNTVGWCFKHAVFQYDSDGDMTPDSPFPRCLTLTTGDVVPPIGNPPHNDAEYFWCTALQATLARIVPVSPQVSDEVRVDRLGRWR